MKATQPGSRRKKIILYYYLTVVLPGFILGYMAYRGISNDQALREKENLMKRNDDLIPVITGLYSFFN
jgi:hypothetical protein